MEKKKKRMALIASKGTLDMAYPPLILASTAAAMDAEVAIFFTLYGVDIVNKKEEPFPESCAYWQSCNAVTGAVSKYTGRSPRYDFSGYDDDERDGKED